MLFGQKKEELASRIGSWRSVDKKDISFYNEGARRKKLKEETRKSEGLIEIHRHKKASQRVL